MKAYDELVPGSERAVEIVDDKLMRDIVRDLRRGPASLPLVSPHPYPKGSGWADPTPLEPPSGVRHVDAICDSFAEQDRLARITELSRTVASMQTSHDAEIERLKSEVARLEAELKKVGK